MLLVHLVRVVPPVNLVSVVLRVFVESLVQMVHQVTGAVMDAKDHRVVGVLKVTPVGLV